MGRALVGAWGSLEGAGSIFLKARQEARVTPKTSTDSKPIQTVRPVQLERGRDIRLSLYLYIYI